MLARGACTEIRSCDQDAHALVLIAIEHEVGVFTPLCEETVLESMTRDPFQILRRDYLVGINVGASKRRSGTCMANERFHLRPQVLG